METIQFLKLNIQNFKAIQNKEIVLSNETILRGQNGAGKSTVADAIWWVLFNKDSNGASNSTIKPLDASGQEIHKLVTEVTLEVLLSGTKKIFTRRQEENWVKERGSTEAVYKGNVQTLLFNESVMKTSEYSNEVGNIIDESKFMMLTNPKHFMSIDWKKRREILLQMLSSNVESQIDTTLKSKPEFYELMIEWTKDINLNKDFKMFYEFLKQKSKQNNQELELIPARIQSLQSTIDDEDDEAQLNLLISSYKQELATIEASQSVKSTDEPQYIKDKIDKIASMRIEADKARTNYEQDKRTRSTELMVKRSDIETKIERLKAQLTLDKNDLVSLNDRKVDLETKRTNLLKTYNDIKNEEYVPSDSKTHCTLCGQQLPEKQLEEHAQKEFEEWTNRKNSRLSEIVQEGSSYKTRIDAISQQLEEINLEKKESQIKELEQDLSVLPTVDQLHFLEEEKQRSEEIDKDIQKLKSEVDAFRLSETAQTQLDVNKERKSQLQALISETDRRLGKLEQVKRNKLQIAVHEAQEVELRASKTRYEVLVNLAQDFEKEKNEMFEKLLSNQFGGSIQWKLFEQQINGGFKPTCDAYLNGIPYADQSSGQKIFTGVEIIKAFQDKYEVSCPVIIDNRETITIPLNIQSQTISMYVDESIAELVVLS